MKLLDWTRVAPCLIGLALAAAAPAQPAPEQLIELRDREISLLRQRLGNAERELADQQLHRLLYQTQLEIAALRGFGVTEPVRYEPLSPARLNRLIDESIIRQYPGERLGLFVWFNTLFGALPEGFDLIGYLKELMGEQAAGIYDPHTDIFYLSPQFKIDSGFGRIVLAHEITHALQDQNYDLLSLGVEDQTNSDQATAALTLAEGDATLAMSEHLALYGNPLSAMLDLPRMLTMDQRKLQQAPLVIRESLLFPYMGGMKFFEQLAGRTRAGADQTSDEAGAAVWRGAIFRDPPETTEQVLHPEKYLARELPAPIMPFGDIDADHWSEDVIGEFYIRTLLSVSLDRARARRAAAGWNGDRLLLMRWDDGRHGLKWITRWDTPADADQFEAALGDALNRHPGQLVFARPAPDTVILEGEFPAGSLIQ